VSGELTAEQRLGQQIKAGMADAKYRAEKLQFDTVVASGVPEAGLRELGVLPPVPPASEGGE
jgi:hypothetical protein